MQNRSQTRNLVAIFMMLLFVLVFSFAIVPAPSVDAQVEPPTATPRDPIWLGYSAARDLIQEEEGVNLSIVRSWEFWQDDWSRPEAAHPEDAAGIDGCVSTVGIAQGRAIYYGWTFVIVSLNNVSYEARVSFDLRDVALCDIKSTAAAPTPNATQAASGNLPAPAAGAGATGSFELGGHATGMTGEAVAAMNRAGMKWYKVQLSVANGVQAGYNQINAAHAAGFKILIGVVGDKAALEADFAGYTSGYATYVAALAEAGADAIEIWNEPNLGREWPRAMVNGARYTEFLAQAYNAIKRTRPATMVISAALAPTGAAGAAGCVDLGFEYACNDDVFMQQMAQAGAANYMDCVGAHYNEGIVSPGTFSGDPRGEFPTYYFGSMTNRVKQYFPSRPVCYTELGYLSPEGMGSALPGAFGWAKDTSVAEQSAWLADVVARGAQRGDIRIMIIWNVDFKRWDTDPMGGYAMIRPDGTCPACDTIGRVMGR